MAGSMLIWGIVLALGLGIESAQVIPQKDTKYEAKAIQPPVALKVDDPNAVKIQLPKKLALVDTGAGDESTWEELLSDEEASIQSVLKYSGKIVDDYYKDISNQVLKIESKLWFTQEDLHKDADEMERMEALQEEEDMDEDLVDEEDEDWEDDDDEDIDDKDDKDDLDEDHVEMDEDELLEEDDDIDDDEAFEAKFDKDEDTAEFEDDEDSSEFDDDDDDDIPSIEHGKWRKGNWRRKLHRRFKKPAGRRQGKPEDAALNRHRGRSSEDSDSDSSEEEGPEHHHGKHAHKGKPRPWRLNTHHHGKFKPGHHRGPERRRPGYPWSSRPNRPAKQIHRKPPALDIHGKPDPPAKPSAPGFVNKFVRRVPEWLRNLQDFLGRRPTSAETMAARATYVRDMRVRSLDAQVARVCQMVWQDRRDRFVALLTRSLHAQTDQQIADDKRYKIDFLERFKECCATDDDKVECVADLYRERNDNYCEAQSPLMGWLLATPLITGVDGIYNKCCPLQGNERHHCFGKMSGSIFIEQETDVTTATPQQAKLPSRHPERNGRRPGGKLTYYRDQKEAERSRVEARCCLAGKKAALAGGDRGMCLRRARMTNQMTRSHKPLCHSSFRDCCLDNVYSTTTVQSASTPSVYDITTAYPTKSSDGYKPNFHKTDPPKKQ